MSNDPRILVGRLTRARAHLAQLATLAALSATTPDARPAYAIQAATVAKVRFLESALLAARMPGHPSARHYRARSQRPDGDSDLL